MFNNLKFILYQNTLDWSNAAMIFGEYLYPVWEKQKD